MTPAGAVAVKLDHDVYCRHCGAVLELVDLPDTMGYTLWWGICHGKCETGYLLGMQKPS